MNGELKYLINLFTCSWMLKINRREMNKTYWGRNIETGDWNFSHSNGRAFKLGLFKRSMLALEYVQVHSRDTKTIKVKMEDASSRTSTKLLINVVGTFARVQQSKLYFSLCRIFLHFLPRSFSLIFCTSMANNLNGILSSIQIQIRDLLYSWAE